MSDHPRDDDGNEQTGDQAGEQTGGPGTAARWRSLPSHTPLAATTASQEVPPKPQAIAEPGNVKLEEATRYPV
ncbi:hypothetical protein [Actinomadura rudentiformis]|uniref:Uncharacterized protein n=1 Tax=Actinomadura rudentiformis TaxID=359158 RepID=A0A6H9YEB9_9ACTN|nr:hypothetical protein [Actinomadura rudentiformis]KAB2342725.1 hypothetical protein F8566_37490 [Actinomadura rudentiformis]